MSRIIKYIGASTVVCMMAGCTTSFEDFNANPYQPSKIPTSGLLSTILNVYTCSQQNARQEVNCMWASFSGQVTATANWNFGKSTFTYYNVSERRNDNSQGRLYGYIYPSFFLIENSAEKKGVIYAMAQLARVYGMQLFVSLQGSIPYAQTKAGEAEAPYNNGQTIWHAMPDDLDNAITTLKSVTTFNINQDLAVVDRSYKGNCSKWLEFANVLKLRMAIRISGVKPKYVQTKAQGAVLGGVMKSVGGGSYDTISDGIDGDGYAVVSGWPEIRANTCLVSYVNGYSDPHRPAYFTPQTQIAAGGHAGVRSSSAEIPEPMIYANCNKLLIATDKISSQPVMYAAETTFPRTGGALRGWNMGGDTRALYEKGVRLSFEEFGVSGADNCLADATFIPGNYVDSSIVGHTGNNYTNQSSITVKWKDGANDAKKLERVFAQKWIACYPDPMNGWASFRRTGYLRILPATEPINADCSAGRGQCRPRFTRSEYNNSKANMEVAVSMLSSGKDSNGADLRQAMKKNGTY